MAGNQQNIDPHKWKKGQSGNPKGRPRKLETVMRDIPPEAQQRIFSVLHQALKLPDEKAAREFVEKEDLGDYGFLLKIVLRSLAGKNGWQTACDILDRLFGRPKQSTDMDVKGDLDFTFKFGDQ